MPAVNDVGEPCAGEPNARFDGRGPETGATYCRTAPAPDPTRPRSNERIRASPRWPYGLSAAERPAASHGRPATPCGIRWAAAGDRRAGHHRVRAELSGVVAEGASEDVGV